MLAMRVTARWLCGMDMTILRLTKNLTRQRVRRVLPQSASLFLCCSLLLLGCCIESFLEVTIEEAAMRRDVILSVELKSR
jgi:hypothetical protein